MKTILKTNITLTLSLIFLFIVNVNAQEKGQWEILNEGNTGSLGRIDFVNNQVGWINAHSRLLYTDDGGKNWISIPLDDNYFILDIDFINESVGWGFAWYLNEVLDIFSDEGIYKTTDGGQSWTIQKDLPDNWWGGLHAVNDSVVYGIFNYQDSLYFIHPSIWKTSDGGSNWIDISPDLANEPLNSISFVDTEVGIITGYNNGIILRTIDGGNTWDEIIIPEFSYIRNFQFINDSTAYFISRGNNSDEEYLCTTTDTLKSWIIKQKHNSSYHIYCYYAIDNDKIIASTTDSKYLENYIMLSIDGGITWEIKNIFSDGWSCQYIYFLDPNNGYLYSRFGTGSMGWQGKLVLRSTDGGNEWRIHNITLPMSDIYFLDSEIGFASGGISEWHDGLGGLFKTEDGGVSWINSFSSRDEIKSVFFVDYKVGFILSPLNLYKTTDQGNKWIEIGININDFKRNDIYFINEDIGWMIGSCNSDGMIFGTSDGGENWEKVWNYPNNDNYESSLNSIHGVNSTAWAVGESGMIVNYTEIDQWQILPSITDLPLKDVFFSDEKHGWIAGGYYDEDNEYLTLLKTSDGGETWREIPDIGFQINDLFFEDSLHGWAVGNDTSYNGNWKEISKSGIILETWNGGNNWNVQIEGLIAPLEAIHSRDGYLWAVGGQGLILKTEDGASWVDQNTGKTYPNKFSLSQNYPNPFNPATKIKFALPKAGKVKIELFNTLGQRVEILLNQLMKAGDHEVEFNGKNLSSGIYFYRIEAGEFQDVKKMILLR